MSLRVSRRAFERVWRGDPRALDLRLFDEGELADLPPAVRRYLAHAIAAGAPRVSAVRLKMHGTIRLGGTWHPFEAEEVLRAGCGFVWRAKVRMKGLPVTGYDRWIDGRGEMRWRLLGAIPVASGDGPDVSRSAAQRGLLEMIWLPTAFLDPAVSLTDGGPDTVFADLGAGGFSIHARLDLAAGGRLRSASMLRWGNPEGHRYDAYPFGALCLRERRFGHFTVPSEVRVGWFFDGTAFQADGEFFRATIDDAVFR